jgi:hypothetical protein
MVTKINFSLNSIIETHEEVTYFVIRNDKGFDIFQKKENEVNVQYQKTNIVNLEIKNDDFQNFIKEDYENYNIKVSFWNTSKSSCYKECKEKLTELGWKLNFGSQTFYIHERKCQKSYAVLCIWSLLLNYEFGKGILDRVDLLKDKILICSYFSKW